MARRSEEQKKDLQIKIVVGTILAVLIGLGFAIGPGLPKILEHARQNKDKPWAAERYYNIAKLMQWSFREEKAQDVFDEFYLTFAGEDWNDDFEDVMLARFGDDWPSSKAVYLPWVNEKFTGYYDSDDPGSNPRPKPVSKERHPLFGKVLWEKGYYFERERDYVKSDHIWACMEHMWPEGSWEHQEATAAKKRAIQRSF